MHFKMMNEYSVDWPFWNQAGSDEDPDLPYLLSDMDDPPPRLPADLTERVRAWTRKFAYVDDADDAPDAPSPE